MSDKKKILVVDDEPDMVEWLTAFFQDNGYETVSARDGNDGFEKVKTEQPDLITLDISMDKESGIRMYRNLNSDEELAKIPVIIVSGVSPDFKKFISSRSQVPPPDGYFEKPVDRDAMLKKIRELIGS
jgi:two-component system cell cycle response regulator DivK